MLQLEVLYCANRQLRIAGSPFGGSRDLLGCLFGTELTMVAGEVCEVEYVCVGEGSKGRRLTGRGTIPPWYGAPGDADVKGFSHVRAGHEAQSF